MFSNSFKKLVRIIMLASVVFAFSGTIYALDDYTVLAPIPCTTTGDANCTNSGTTATLQSYLPGAFRLAIGLSAVLAFIVITYGGILYATSDAISGKETGREYITNAVVGLLLVIGAWAILYTINPKMLEFNLTLPVPKLQEASNYVSIVKELSGPVVAGYALNSTQLAENQKVKDALWNSNPDGTKKISVNHDACSSGQTKDCTNLVGLPDNAINGVEQLNKDCNCAIKITGGTEGGHVSHGPGKAALDLNKSAELDQYIKSHASPNPVTVANLGTIYKVNMGTAANPKIVDFVDESASAPGSSGAHWHVKFP